MKWVDFMKKYKELQAKTPEELCDMLELLLKERFNLRFQKASGSLKKMSEFKRVRRDIARVRTRMSELKINGNVKGVK